jgi:hypothetical protein
MLKCLGDLIGETIEAYVDDIVVKSNKHFFAPLLGMDLKPPYLVIALKNSNKHF